MKRKFWTVFLTVATAVCMAFGFAACGEKKSGNEEGGSDLWTMERVYAKAQELGFQGTLEELIAMFKGADGAPGKDGVGIQSIEIDENGHLKVTLTNGTVKDLGKITADNVAPQEGTEGLQYQKRKDENGNEYAAVIGLGTAWDTDIVIPATYRGLPVKEIGDNAFSANYDARNATLTSVSIPKGIETIGANAFYGCSGLTGELEIPENVTSIGDSAFCRCSGLQSVIWNAENCTKAGNDSFPAFPGCTNLSNVTFGEKVKTIPAYAFFGCIGLTSIDILGSETSIGDYAFVNCSGLTEITVAENNQTYHVQGNCLIETGSKTLILGCKTSKIPDDGSVIKIGSYAFRGCNGLTGDLKIPDSVTLIGDWAFLQCSGLNSVTIGSGVTEIGDHAFYECSGLTSVTIGSGVTSIGDFAFYACIGLHSVTFEENSELISIGKSAFVGCSGLTGELKIPDSVTSIGDSAFSECRGLQSVSFGKDSMLTSIEWYAFRDCGGLTSISIPSGVTEIGDAAFKLCRELAEIRYNGTIEAWKQIEKGSDWDLGTGNYTVICTDGTITKDGIETYYNNAQSAYAAVTPRKREF